MPIYDFQCDKCGTVREVILGEDGQPLDKFTLRCFNCGSPQMTRQYPSANFVVNGFNAKNGYSKEA